MNGQRSGISVTEKKYPEGQILQFGGVLELGLKLQQQQPGEDRKLDVKDVASVKAGEVDDDDDNHSRSFLCNQSRGREDKRPTLDKVCTSHLNVNSSSNTDDVVVSVPAAAAAAASSNCPAVITEADSNTTSCPVLSPCGVVCSSDTTTSGVAIRPLLLQPFGISPSSTPTTTSAFYQQFPSSATNNPLFAYPVAGGGGMAAAATWWGSFGHHQCYYHQEHPFTGSQWKELERQAMIYKHMVASVPVPPHLLFSISSSSSDHHQYATYAPSSWGKVGGGLYNFGWGNAKIDAEPGRCKRTDGKKWRCSRDVAAPNQKYCERHLHRGRPRSRKPVEPLRPATDFLPINKDFNPNNNQLQRKKTRLGGGGGVVEVHKEGAANNNQKQKSSYNFIGLSPSTNSDLCYNKPVVSTTPFEKTSRNLGWCMKGEDNPTAATTTTAVGQYWQNLEGQTLAVHGSFPPGFFHQNLGHHDEPLNLESSADFYPTTTSTDPRDAFPTDPVLPDNKAHIDGQRSKLTVSSSLAKISPSSLALSMGDHNNNSVHMCEIQMGLAISDSKFPNGGEAALRPPQLLSCLNSGSSRVPSGLTPGGPLAEVLRHTAASSPLISDPASTLSCKW